MTKILLSPKEAIALLGISRATLYRMFQTGELKKFKLRGKTVVKRSDLDNFLNNGLKEA